MTNNLGENVFYSTEKSGYFSKLICGKNRHFEMIILDSKGQEIIHLSRPFTCVLDVKYSFILLFTIKYVKLLNQ